MSEFNVTKTRAALAIWLSLAVGSGLGYVSKVLEQAKPVPVIAETPTISNEVKRLNCQFATVWPIGALEFRHTGMSTHRILAIMDTARVELLNENLDPYLTTVFDTTLSAAMVERLGPLPNLQEYVVTEFENKHFMKCLNNYPN